jgi:hypothetical protein
LKKTEGLLHEYAIPSTHDITDNLIKGTEFGKFTAKGFPTAEEFLEKIGALFEKFVCHLPKSTIIQFERKSGALLLMKSTPADRNEADYHIHLLQLWKM